MPTETTLPPAGASPTFQPTSTPAFISGGTGIIACSVVTRRFGKKLALAPLDLAVGPGGVTGLLGPNGSGKSTLMRCMTGLVRPDAGSISVDGIPLRGDGTAIRRAVTYSPGELHLYGEMRGGEHIDWLLRGRDKAAKRRARERATDQFELPLDAKVRGYSHGMKRQLCFAAALAPDVGVRILDEPTEGLDPSRRSQVLDALLEDARRGTTVLLSSHHLGEVDRACDRLVFMNEGHKVADETPDSVHERAARLLHLGWSRGTDLDGIEARLAGDDVESIELDGTRVTIVLRERDPRPFLARFAALANIPAPKSLGHGRVSLQELYRVLYGVEGT